MARMSEVAARLRSQRRVWAHPGSSHDRIVRLALIVLPIGDRRARAHSWSLAPLFMGGDVSFVLDKNKVAMSARSGCASTSAEYRGHDEKGQPFPLHAGSAVQKSSAEPIVQLRDLARRRSRCPTGPPRSPPIADATTWTPNGSRSTARSSFQTSDGYTLNTHDATVDLKTRVMQSGGAVTGNTPTGTFSGDKLTADPGAPYHPHRWQCPLADHCRGARIGADDP